MRRVLEILCVSVVIRGEEHTAGAGLVSKPLRLCVGAVVDLGDIW